jgi:outer membrane protease
MRRIEFAGLAFSACMALPALADDVKLQSLDGSVTFSGSYGLTSIKANEYVYEGKAKISQLIWESRYVNTLNGALHVELPKDWYLNANGTIGLGGDGHMADYDWLQPGSPWSDRSLHPDTRLNHYYVASLEIGRDLLSYDGTDVGLGAGFKYTDVKWSAWGGSYIYSENGFRDSRGDFNPDEKGISYRQSWPVPYLGANLSHHEGAWTFASALQAGMAINAYGTDDHWVRTLRFYDYFETTPTVSLSGSIEYAAWNNAAFFVSGSFDKMFHTRADTKAIDTVSGEKQWFRDDAGGDYLSTTVSLGLKGKF